DQVTKNQLIGRIGQPDLVNRIAAAKAELAERLAEQQNVASFASEDLSLRDTTQKLQESKLKDTIAFAEQRLIALQQQIDNQQALLAKGLVTKQNLLQAQQEYFSTKDLLERSRADLQQLPLERLTTQNTKQQEMVRSQLAINETKRRIESLEQQLEFM